MPSNQSDILLIANARSGRGRAIELADQTHQLLRQNKLESQLLTVDQFEAQATLPTAHRVVIFGGDGTIRSIVSRYIASSPDQVPHILPVPVGTANLLGKHLRLYTRDDRIPALILSSLKAHHVREIDVGSVNSIPFLLMCSCGFDAEVVHKVSARRTGPISKFSYVKPFFESLRNFDAPTLTVEVDGKIIFGPAKGFVMIANAREYGAGFSLLPDARTDDRLLDVRTLKSPTRRRLVSGFVKSAVGLFEGPAVRGSVVRVHSDRPVPIQVDGDPAGFTPADIRLVTQRLRLIVP